ncbi:AraC family transcriptional regulator [Lactobacillus gallinarum]|nr:AraC family transcriptional regulator [Lactobacillus gallinarum]
MEWSESISRVIDYIESNITGELTITDIAKHVNISPYYFQKGFSMICGLTVGEYIKKRRLTLAGSELVSTDEKIIDIALKYGYNSPDSFTKAFFRFHGATPTAIRRGEVAIKSFAPLKIKLPLIGRYTMNYKITKKAPFTVIGISAIFKYETASKEIPQFWQKFNASGKNKKIANMYGISIDKDMHGDEFEYLIADNYNPLKEIPAGFTTYLIPEYTWAIFPCRGAKSMYDTHRKIFTEWLPQNKDYEIAAGYNIEMYSNPLDYAKGVEDENYYSEIWIPVRNK